MTDQKRAPSSGLKRPSLYAVRLVAVGDVSGELARKALALIERRQHVEGMLQLWSRRPVIHSRPTSLDVAETRFSEVLDLMAGMPDPPIAAEIVSISPADRGKRRPPPLIGSRD